MRAGHEVKVLNLSVVRLDARSRRSSRARRGRCGACRAGRRTGAASAIGGASITGAPPSAHVVVGGPHATPLAREMLRHYCRDRHGRASARASHVPRARRRARARRADRGASPGPSIARTGAIVDRPGPRGHRGPRRARVAARLVRHAHPDDVARVRVATARSAARRRAGGGAIAGESVALRSRCAREARRARARQDDPDQGRHVHDEQASASSSFAAASASAELELLLELRHARRRPRPTSSCARCASRDASA